MGETPRDSALGGGGGVSGRLRDFSAALRRGDAQAALEAARDACLAEPNRAEAHYAFGQAWMASGKPARAEQAFAVAVKLRPGFADGWINYGLARYNQGAVEDAKRCFAHALQAQPGHPAATSNLAALLRLTGGYEAADKLLREALARNPHDAGARLNLVAEALSEERPAEALALLNAVEPPADDIAAARHWHLQRAAALIALGRPDKAQTALGEFDALGPAPPESTPSRLWCDVLLAVSQSGGAPTPAPRRKRWSRRSTPWARPPCSNTGSWRATTSPSSGRARATTPRPSRNGAKAMRSCGRSSRSRARRRALTTTRRSRPSRPSATPKARAR